MQTTTTQPRNVSTIFEELDTIATEIHEKTINGERPSISSVEDLSLLISELFDNMIKHDSMTLEEVSLEVVKRRLDLLGKKIDTAASLGIERSTLDRKLKQ